MKAHQFTLPDQNGKKHSLSDYLGKWVVVYFYPKDNTPGCTIEACSFRDTMSELTSEGIVVLGISKDSASSHQKFISKYNLNFTLLSDETGAIIEEYGAMGMKKMFGKEFKGILRKSFLIDPEGNIAKEYPKVSPDAHAQEILADVQKLKM